MNTTEIRTTTKVEDDRSLGDKAKDAFNNVAEKTKDMAHNIKEKITGESHVTDSDIAHAARKHDEMQQKEERDRFRAEGAADRREQLQADANRLQDKEFEHRKKEEKHYEKRLDQADEVARLQQKQQCQQAEKCREKCHEQVRTDIPSATTDYKVTRVTEIH